MNSDRLQPILSEYACNIDPTLPKCGNCKRGCDCPLGHRSVRNIDIIQNGSDVEYELPPELEFLVSGDGYLGAIKPGHYEVRNQKSK